MQSLKIIKSYTYEKGSDTGKKYMFKQRGSEIQPEKFEIHTFWMVQKQDGLQIGLAVLNRIE